MFVSFLLFPFSLTGTVTANDVLSILKRPRFVLQEVIGRTLLFGSQYEVEFYCVGELGSGMRCIQRFKSGMGMKLTICCAESFTRSAAAETKLDELQLPRMMRICS
jgi:hypothetical protein